MGGEKNYFPKAAAISLALTAAAGVLTLTGCGLLDQAAETFYDGLGTLVAGKEKVADAVSRDRYGYQCLDDETKIVYDQIVATVEAQEEKAVVSTEDVSVLEQAFSAVLADYGEFFWISGYQYNSYTSGEKVIGLEIVPAYTMSREEREKAQKQVEAVADRWLQGLPHTAGDYEKAKYVFETLIEQVEYDENAENNQNILSVFLNRKTVCQGYAEAASYLLRRLGISSAVVTGYVKEEPHAWNLVSLDGEYYFLDVTWGNSQYTGEGDEKQKIINYAYLNMTTEDLEKTHRIEAQIPIPECTATRDNYYRKEACYFDRWSPEEIGAVWKQAWESGEKTVTVRLANESLYDQTMDYFIKERKLSSYCRGMRTVQYLENQDLFVLTLQF